MAYLKGSDPTKRPSSEWTRNAQATTNTFLACSDMEELLTSVSHELVDEFSDGFFASRGRKILHDSKRWRVLDSWSGDPPEHSRQTLTTSPPCCLWADTISLHHHTNTMKCVNATCNLHVCRLACSERRNATGVCTCHVHAALHSD